MSDQVKDARNVFTESTDDKPFWLKGNGGFSFTRPEDDYLHPEANKSVTAASLTETQYLGWCVPEARLQCYAYFWHHPNLGVLSGGLYAFFGEKAKSYAADLCSYTNYQDARQILTNDLRSYRMENGYSVSVIEPMKKLHMGFVDKTRGHEIDLKYTAVSPGIMFEDGKHFEQAMKVEGEAVIRGKKYRVDCYNVRDRSWARPRPEDNMPLPPMSWMTAVFDENFSFCINLFDDARHQTYLKGSKFEVDSNHLVAAGWIWRDGRINNVVKAWKRVMRDPNTMVPRLIEMEVVDDSGRTTFFRGVHMGAHCPIPVWCTMHMSVNMMRWECEGRTIVGEAQEPWWSDYLQEFLPKSQITARLPDVSL